MPEKIKIDHVIILGDSLSDRKAMYARELAGIIPMKIFSGLFFKSKSGRFTNGLVWGDYFAQKIVADKEPFRATELNLNDADEIAAPWAINFMRTYCEGGLTAHNYSGLESSNPLSELLNVQNEVTQEILSCLDAKRQILLEDDSAMGITSEQKRSTLIIEWSGANDLITVNSTPTQEIAVKAIQARIHNILELIKAGYSNFVLFNLPDLSLTPRFQNGAEDVRNNVQDIATFFNTRLAIELAALKLKYPNCTLNLHDVNSIFTAAYANPEQFGFNRRKLRSPMCTGTLESMFNTAVNSIIGGEINDSNTENMFWDEVHPTTKVHELLEETFYRQCFKPNYEFVLPTESLLQQFRTVYGKDLAESQRGCCGCCITPGFKNYKTASFKEIREHATKDPRTRKTLETLGWNSKAGLNLRHPSLVPLAKPARMAMQ